MLKHNCLSKGYKPYSLTGGHECIMNFKIFINIKTESMSHFEKQAKFDKTKQNKKKKTKKKTAV